jgi:hypothetical protein
MQTYTIWITRFPTSDFPTFLASIDETGATMIRGDRLDPQGDPRLGARFPGISDHLMFSEGLTVEPAYVSAGAGPDVLVYRSREAEVHIHDVASRPVTGSSDISDEELNEILAALVAKANGQNAFPEEAVVRYIERLVNLGHIGIIHRVVNLYCQRNRRSKAIIASHLPRILSTQYRPIAHGAGTAAFQIWAMQPAQKELLDELKANADNSLLPEAIDNLVLAFEARQAA